MNMTPEERFNKQVWEILKLVKEESLATEKDKPVRLYIPYNLGEEIVSRDRTMSIFYKLQEWESLKVRENPWEYPSSTKEILYLDLYSEKFDEVYNKYQKLNEPRDTSDLHSNKPTPFQQKNLSKEEIAFLKAACRLGKKEEKLLKILSDLKPHDTKNLTTQVPTSAYKKLKESLRRKIKDRGYMIETIKGKGFSPSFYQLKRLPISKQE